ncbi:uncharacterized protein LOC141857379 [Brevipalpus obovatus]|uniref:uncharacterized protein LOC141857379 n=1 Tax=Brevipalpus obovatus TaxID=246614 RepID=UPI003D9F63B4
MLKYSTEERVWIVKEMAKNSENPRTEVREWKSYHQTGSAPDIRTIVAIWGRLYETGRVEDNEAGMGHSSTLITGDNKQLVKEFFETKPSESVRRESMRVGINRSTLQRKMKELHLTPYKIQINQAIREKHKEQRFEFSQTTIDSEGIDLNKIWFSDEAHLNLDGHLNKQNYRFWGTQRPEVSLLKNLHRKKVLVWAAICSKGLYGSYFFESTINGERKSFGQISSEERLQDLGHLINSFQPHTKHGRHCLREKQGSKQLTCRFKFPKPTQDQASISRSEGYNQFCPKRNDQWVARYNPLITQVWRANADVSPVTSKQAVSNYVCKYAAKEEVASPSFKNSARDIAQQQPDESSARRAIQKVMIFTIGERNYSAQEIDETVKVRETVVEKYAKRPQELSGESLLHFIKNYVPVGSNFRKRQKEIIVRVFPQLKLTGDPIEDEKYYKLQCILTIPFTQSYEKMLEDHVVTRWRDLYEQNRDRMIEEMEFLDPENDDPLPAPVNEENYQNPFMVVAGFRGEINDQVIGTRLIDVAYDWNATSSRIPDFSEAHDFLKTFRTNGKTSSIQSPHTISFSSEQQKILDILDGQLRSLTVRVPRVYKRVVVQGKAGLGKSTIIREIVNRVVSVLGTDSIRVCAPTGAAAVNIEGHTIHSLLRIPLNIKKMQSLNGEAARKFQNEMRQLKFVIIDEMSMIGARLLNVVERRLREIKPGVDEPFGGLFIYLFGDFRQLPPVKDSPLYSSIFFDEMASQGKIAFKQFHKFIELSQSHRQDASQASFIRVLDNLANGTFTHEDLCLLSTRSRAHLSN